MRAAAGRPVGSTLLMREGQQGAQNPCKKHQGMIMIQAGEDVRTTPTADLAPS